MASGDWAYRIKKANSISEKAALHNARFEVWNKFINDYANGNGLKIQTIDRVPSQAFEKKVVGMGNAWSKKILKKNGKIETVFDASFGSMDPTSDLDIGVVSLNKAVIDEWIIHLEKAQKQIKTITFTEYWDSNFYFEPGVLQGGKLVSKLQANLETALPTKETMVQDMELIQKYADAYIKKTSMTLGKYSVYPNPEAPGFTQKAELEQYKALSYYGNVCFTTFDSTTYGQMACCKTEGLISPGSLAICRVFGAKIQQDYINDDTKTIWRLIAAFEMLLNLKMHKHGDQIKTKYLERLDNVLKKSPNACTKKTRTSLTRTSLTGEIASLTGEITNTKKKKLIKLKGQVLNLIGLILEDEEDGTKCPEGLKAKAKFKSLDDDIAIIKVLILKTAKDKKAKKTTGAKFIVYYKENYVF